VFSIHLLLIWGSARFPRVHGLWFIITALAGYLLGSIPTGYLAGRSRGIDIRKQGSGNIGATNVFRVLGKRAGIFVLFIDAMKGLLAVLVVPPMVLLVLGNPFVEPGALETSVILGGVSAILGHNFTCWLRFKGGKGIATTAGAVLALAPLAFLSALAVWLIVLAWSRYVSLASIAAAVCLPLLVFLWNGSPGMIWISAGLGALAVFKHRSNISRLLHGTEHRAWQKRPVGEPNA
jgi:acyl phosphate:glycerol-3-phosphate acyltransferase